VIDSIKSLPLLVSPKLAFAVIVFYTYPLVSRGLMAFLLDQLRRYHGSIFFSNLLSDFLLVVFCFLAFVCLFPFFYPLPLSNM
jgi:hypothetical protein